MSERLTPKEVKALRKRLQGRVKLSKKELSALADEQQHIKEHHKDCLPLHASARKWWQDGWDD